jgi:hypothetical protein
MHYRQAIDVLIQYKTVFWITQALQQVFVGIKCCMNKFSCAFLEFE